MTRIRLAYGGSGGMRSAENRGRRLANGLLSVAALFWAALREIFDESAYRRFLRRERAPASRASYAAFLRERDRGPHRPRCC